MILRRFAQVARVLGVPSASDDRHESPERELLRDLTRGDKEIAAGIGHDLDSVLAEADILLAAD
jgi:hypothetical protein